MSEPKTVFVLHRLNWVRVWNSKEHGYHKQPGHIRIDTFDTFEEAEAQRSQLEEKARRFVNPFRCGRMLDDQTHFDADRLHDWLLDAGIDPPQNRQWAKWWKKVKSKLDEMQWAKLWQALDKLQFYEIEERIVRPLVYVVTAIGWQYNDVGYDVEAEGGRALLAFRSREKAEDHRLELEREIRKERANSLSGYDYYDRVWHQTPFQKAPPADTLRADQLHESDPVFYEVVEVELEGEPDS